MRADGLTATTVPPAAAAALGADVDGVLGQDFLSRFAFTIDYRRSRIVWHEADYVPVGSRLTLVPAQDRWLVELPQAASAPANATARIAIQIRRYIELFLLLIDYASLVAVQPQCTCILPLSSYGWDEKSMRSL